MDVFPSRNLGAGEPWGRTVEGILREHETTVTSAKQDTDNNSRTVQASLVQLKVQTERTDELLLRLNDAVDRLPRHAVSYDTNTDIFTPPNTWVTAAETEIVVPGDRSYAVVTCNANVRFQAASGSGDEWVWMALKITAKGNETVSPTDVGVPLSFVETASWTQRLGSVDQTFHLNDVAGQTIKAEIRIYVTGSTAFTEKIATLTTTGMFVRDSAQVAQSGTRPPEYTEEAPPLPGGGTTPGGGSGTGSQFKWPMNPQALNTRNGRPQDGYKTSGRPTHLGVDMSFPPTFQNGMPVRAIADGRVVRAYWESGGGGWFVELDHGRFRSGYAHGGTVNDSTFKVSAGQQVTQGQHLMNAGTTGQSTGPHLHFQISDMSLTGSFWTSTIDPELFMAQYNPNDEYV